MTDYKVEAEKIYYKNHPFPMDIIKDIVSALEATAKASYAKGLFDGQKICHCDKCEYERRTHETKDLARCANTEKTSLTELPDVLPNHSFAKAEYRRGIEDVISNSTMVVKYGEPDKFIIEKRVLCELRDKNEH